MRDPKIDPECGDYLRVHRTNWLVVGAHNDGTYIAYREGPDFYLSGMYIEEWVALMADATVLHVAGHDL